jgi:hypothetical protein
VIDFSPQEIKKKFSAAAAVAVAVAAAAAKKIERK